MTKLSKSEQKFHKRRELYQKKLDAGQINFDQYKNYIDLIDMDEDTRLNKEQDQKFKQNNLEFDLRSTNWILDKVRASEIYAQNLYAAMCNNDFIKVTVKDTPENLLEVLKNGLPTWSCTWRYAGGIVADMRERGDYIDWYCSGIKGASYHDAYNDDKNLKTLTEEQKKRLEVVEKYVSESTVTDEIRTDLKKLGWSVVEYKS